MASRYGWPVALSLVAFATVSTPAVPDARQTRPEHRRKADFDIRDTHPAAPPRLTPRASSRGGAPQRDRLNRDSGSLRVLEQSGLTLDARSQSSAISRWLASEARRLGLTAGDLGSLALVRDYTTRATGVRHLLFRQVLDGHPVFDSAVAIHVAANGRVLRITSNAAPGDGRSAIPTLAAATAALAAGQHGDGTPGAPELAWLPVAGALRLAWHVVVTADEDVADVLVDAQTSELLIRRSRSRDAAGDRPHLPVGRHRRGHAPAARPDAARRRRHARLPATGQLRAAPARHAVPRPRDRRRIVRTARRQQRRDLSRGRGRVGDRHANGRRMAVRLPPQLGRHRQRPRSSSARTSSTTSSTTSASTRPQGTFRPTTSAAAASAAIRCT